MFIIDLVIVVVVMNVMMHHVWCQKWACRAHLLQQHCVVSLEGLEDVVVTAQRPKPVDCCIAMPATALTAYGQCLSCELCCVRLQACTAPSQGSKRSTILQMLSSLPGSCSVASGPASQCWCLVVSVCPLK